MYPRVSPRIPPCIYPWVTPSLPFSVTIRRSHITIWPDFLFLYRHVIIVLMHWISLGPYSSWNWQLPSFLIIRRSGSVWSLWPSSSSTSACPTRSRYHPDIIRTREEGEVGHGCWSSLTVMSRIGGADMMMMIIIMVVVMVMILTTDHHDPDNGMEGLGVVHHSPSSSSCQPKSESFVQHPQHRASLKCNLNIGILISNTPKKKQQNHHILAQVDVK